MIETGFLKRTACRLAKRSARPRTIVRFPTKAKKTSPLSALSPIQEPKAEELTHVKAAQQQPLPFNPINQNQQSFQSSLFSYGIAGVGVGLGVIFVRVVLGI